METQGQVKVQAMMTGPRYENTWCRTIIETAVRAVGIPLNVSLGVYYGQCMQRMMEDAVENELDYIVTIDGDTVFTKDQLLRLISIVHQENLDALAGIQLKRGIPTMLGFKEGVTMEKWSGYPIQVDAAHFGLTVLRVSAIATTPKPWFYCKPDEDGTWGDHRIDSDVWFWKQWKEAGHKIHLDPGCRLGHLEEMVVMHDENMKPMHLYPKEFVKYHADQAAEELETVSAGGVVE